MNNPNDYDVPIISHIQLQPMQMPQPQPVSESLNVSTEPKDYLLSTDRKDFMVSSKQKDYMVATEPKDYAVSDQKDFLVNKQKDYIITSDQKEFIITSKPYILNTDTNYKPTETTETQPIPEHKPKVEKKKKEAIDGQAREIIFKVIKFFESEKQNRGYAFPVENVVKRACAATGLSESTIKRIKRDGLRAEATQTRMTGPKKKRVRKTKVQLDYFQLCALRGIVNSYAVRKEVPTLGKILAAAKMELNYRGGKESLRLILLNKLGIKFKKCEKKNKKPPEETQQQPVLQQQQQVLHTPMMEHIKPMENQCVYTNMVPPVSY